MNIDVRSNIAEIAKKLDATKRQQLPFATAMAINAVATDAAKAITETMAGVLDRPTSFTQKAFLTNAGRFYGKIATKRRLIADILAKPAQAEYLKYQIFGGPRRAKGRARNVAVPTKNAKLNKYGNVPNRRAGLIKLPNRQFITTFRDIRGVWERYGSKRGQIRLLHVFYDEVDYKPLFNPWKITQTVVNRRFNRHFGREFAKALRSAK